MGKENLQYIVLEIVKTFSEEQYRCFKREKIMLASRSVKFETKKKMNQNLAFCTFLECNADEETCFGSCGSVSGGF